MMKNRFRKPKSLLIRIDLHILNILLVLTVIMAIANAIVVGSAMGDIKGHIVGNDEALTKEETEELRDFQADCIMVLGASVYSSGEPSPMLRDRLDAAIELYNSGVAPKLLMSGDNGQKEYNELDAMQKYAVKAGVPPEDIFCDYAGFSTYESVYRASYIFQVRRMIVVTQKYHLYRALYGCHKMGIAAKGVASDQERYHGQIARDVREMLARTKDVGMWIIKPNPTYLGDPVPITGEGNAVKAEAAE